MAGKLGQATGKGFLVRTAKHLAPTRPQHTSISLLMELGWSLLYSLE